MLKRFFIRLGSHIPAGAARKLARAGEALELGAWLRREFGPLPAPVAGREDLFRQVAAAVGERPVLYLEFGVWQGEATRLWSTLLAHPESVLHGFDSFEGLPEDWGANARGTFSTGGRVPQIDDPRVRFFKGWFHDVLPGYEPPQREVVVFNLDADLYSSTAYVLRTLKNLVREGTWLYFDEFSSLGNEERAFREFIAETGLRFRLEGVTAGLHQALFRCLGSREAR